MEDDRWGTILAVWVRRYIVGNSTYWVRFRLASHLVGLVPCEGAEDRRGKNS